MSFDTEKKRYIQSLYKPDKSKKGSVDKEISKLIDYINSLENFYTTSSCAGRIVLLEKSDNQKKHEVNWLVSSHDYLDENLNLDDFKFSKETWLKQESFILHICAKTIEDATKILNIAKACGLKRSGIITISKRIIIEIIGSEQMAIPIFEKRLLITDDYFKYIIKKANQKLKKNKYNIDKFYKNIKTI